MAAQIFFELRPFPITKRCFAKNQHFLWEDWFSWNFFPGRWNEMLSLVTSFISASVSVACGLPRKPVQLVRGMHHPLCLAGGILEWAELSHNGGSRWVNVGGSYGIGWKGAGSPGQNATSCLGIRETSVWRFRINVLFLNFFQEEASGFCHSVWFWSKSDSKCWDFTQDEVLWFLVMSFCNKSD